MSSPSILLRYILGSVMDAQYKYLTENRTQSSLTKTGQRDLTAVESHCNPNIVIKQQQQKTNKQKTNKHMCVQYIFHCYHLNNNSSHVSMLVEAILNKTSLQQTTCNVCTYVRMYVCMYICVYLIFSHKYC